MNKVSIEFQFRTSSFIDSPIGNLKITLHEIGELKPPIDKYFGLEIRISKFL